jgi:hypothetical protein
MVMRRRTGLTEHQRRIVQRPASRARHGSTGRCGPTRSRARQRPCCCQSRLSRQRYLRPEPMQPAPENLVRPPEFVRIIVRALQTVKGEPRTGPSYSLDFLAPRAVPMAFIAAVRRAMAPLPIPAGRRGASGDAGGQAGRTRSTRRATTSSQRFAARRHSTRSPRPINIFRVNVLHRFGR